MQKKRKKHFYNSIGTRLTLMCCLFVLLPTLLLSVWLLENWRQGAIQDRASEMERTLYALSGEVNRTSELCNLSTQVFLNTRSLQEYLQRLQSGEQIPVQEMLSFYRGDIASLEKLVVGNPYLYTIRAYSVNENITEMMPILFSAKRMERLPWNFETLHSGTWYLDYADNLFSTGAVPHVMSLLTRIESEDGVLVGALEVGVAMDDLLPELFRPAPGREAFLLLENGARYGSAPAQDLLQKCTAIEPQASAVTVREVRSGTGDFLVGAVSLEPLNGTYYCVDSLTALNKTIQARQLMMAVILTAAAVLLILVINLVIQNMLRQLYRVLDGVRSFSEGNLDATIEASSRDEIGVFSHQVNDLLENIRRLMQSNMERELLVKNTEIRALQNQINAHFIYNVLEAIKMMAEIDENYPIADAVTSLGKLLRYSMRWSKSIVSLFEEIDYIKNYLILMNLRFDYEIHLAMEVPDELMLLELPKISLQPIVENAVVHGGGNSGEDRTIHLKAYRQDELCCIEISDDGPGLDAEQLAKMERQIEGLEQTRSSSGHGIGLKNVQDRLRMMFGENCGLTVFSQPGQGTTVRVVVPCRYVRKEEPQ